MRLRQLVTSPTDRKFRSPVIGCGCTKTCREKNILRTSADVMSEKLPTPFLICHQSSQRFFKIYSCFNASNIKKTNRE